MREVNLLKNLPWLVLFLLFAAGTALWLLFVNERHDQLKQSFRVQLERVADELFRSRLEGRLGPNALPEGIQAFAVYGPQGELVAEWGDGSPSEIQPSLDPWAQSFVGENHSSGTVSILKRLDTLRPRMTFWAEEDGHNEEQDKASRMGPGMSRRSQGQVPIQGQGFLYVSVADTALQARLWGWTVGGVVGILAWSGFLAFIGVLWFRTRRYQTALVQHRELLQFAEASRTLSHELQNPLSAILLQTALLKRAAGGEPASEVSIIEEEAHRMSALVSRVRDFLKDPQGQPEQVDLAELAASLQGRFAVAVSLSVEGTPPFAVRFDPHRLRSVVENLIKNAVESGPDPQPGLRLYRPKAGVVRLEVLDSGTGFSSESLRQALNPFYTTKTTGTGIGLAIADSFVRAAGGKLKLENRPEGGARISLDLPESPEVGRS